MNGIDGLNPCFNGRWSARTRRESEKRDPSGVLILVLMEDGLRGLSAFFQALLSG